MCQLKLSALKPQHNHCPVSTHTSVFAHVVSSQDCVGVCRPRWINSFFALVLFLYLFFALVKPGHYKIHYYQCMKICF